MTPTVISLHGFCGSGKSALLTTLQAGHAHLLGGVPVLRRALAEGCGAYFTPEGLDAAHLHESLEAARAGRPYVVGEGITDLPGATSLPDAYRIVMVLTMVENWMAQARREWRWRHYEDTDAERARMSIASPPDLVPLFQDKARTRRAETVFVDARDYPLRELSPQEAAALCNGRLPSLPPAPARTDYHKGVFIRGRWWGSEDPDDEAAAQARVAAVLPEDLVEKSVLDIGASKGLFSFAALDRGAASVMAVEQEPECVDFIRQVRTHERLNVSTAQMNAMTEELPLCWLHGQAVRYDLALLLNVLHWSLTPEVLLARTLAVCEECILETPYTVGHEPYRDPHGSWPELQCLPPMWAQTRAAESGFRVAAMENSPFYPGYRMIIRLKREV